MMVFLHVGEHFEDSGPKSHLLDLLSAEPFQALFTGKGPFLQFLPAGRNKGKQAVDLLHVHCKDPALKMGAVSNNEVLPPGLDEARPVNHPWSCLGACGLSHGPDLICQPAPFLEAQFFHELGEVHREGDLREQFGLHGFSLFVYGSFIEFHETRRANRASIPKA